jgi:hypothetical protein
MLSSKEQILHWLEASRAALQTHYAQVNSNDSLDPDKPLFGLFAEDRAYTEDTQAADD